MARSAASVDVGMSVVCSNAPNTSSAVWESAFGRGSGHGLFELGAAEVGTALPPNLSYWRDFAARLVTAFCTHPDLDAHHAPIAAPQLARPRSIMPSILMTYTNVVSARRVVSIVPRAITTALWRERFTRESRESTSELPANAAKQASARKWVGSCAQGHQVGLEVPIAEAVAARRAGGGALAPPLECREPRRLQ